MEPLDVDKPMEAIKEWQDWYRKHRIVAQVDQPLKTKNSRESLDDTSKTTTTLDGRDNLVTDYCKAMSFQKAKEYFADTFAEFTNELSGKDFYKAFYAAAIENLESVEKEYRRAKDLVDMLRYKENA
jgi:hypothetical protein